MFTFSSGFEAATLKIPNKEYTSYGGIAGAASGTTHSNGLRGPAFQTYGAQNDPYSIDGPRDGTVGHSWPTSDDLTSSQAHFLSAGINGIQAGTVNPAAISPNTNAMQPRKQIIGFAKFRSREEALIARDVLQGRRVDIEKGAVLKAEMAKKNLHTKRGVGPVPAMNVNVNSVVPPPPVSVGVPTIGVGLQQHSSSVQQQQQQQAQIPPHLAGLDSFGSAEFKLRESTCLSRLGWRDASLSVQTSQHPSDLSSISGREDEERRRVSMSTALSGLSLGSSTSSATPTLRGARERVEDERRKDESERETHSMRPRGNTSVAAFDGFSVNVNAGSSVPNSLSIGATGISRQTSSHGGTMTTTSGGSGTNSSAILTPSTPMSLHAEVGFGDESPSISGPDRHQLQKHDELVGPWDKINPAIPGKNGNRSRSETYDSTSPMVTQASDGGLDPSLSISNSIGTDSAQYQPQHHHDHQLNDIGISVGTSSTGGSNPSTGNASPTLLSPASHASNGSGSSNNSGGSGFSVNTTGAQGTNMRGTVDQNPPVSPIIYIYVCGSFLFFFLLDSWPCIVRVGLMDSIVLFILLRSFIV